MTRKALGRGLNALLRTVETTTAGLAEVAVDQIDPNPFQPRRTFSADKLKELAELLRRNPDVQVTIQGHAWDEGTPTEALRLSQDRADAVLRYLIEEEGLSPRNVSSIGFGETMPLLEARTPEAAAMNRRVEVIIVSKP